MNKYVCPVCGYKELTEPPYDENGYGSYEICDSCGFEFGVDDEDKGFTFETYREKWIEEGYPFFNKTKVPPDWNKNLAIEQLKILNKKPG